MAKKVTGREFTPPPKKRRGCLVSVLIALFLFIGLTVVLAIVMPKTEKPPKQSVLAETMNLTADQEAVMQAVFYSCGIDTIKSAKVAQTREDRTSYHVRDVGTSAYIEPIVVYVNNENKTVDAIYYDDHDIYENGIVIGKVSDYYIMPVQEGIPVLFEAEKFSLITEEQLVEMLGEPSEKEDWTNQTSATVGYKLTTYRYIDGDVCYEYNFCLTTSGQKPLTYMLVTFNYNGGGTDLGVGLSTEVLARVGIKPNASMRKEADTGAAIKWSNVSGAVYEVWAQHLGKGENGAVDWLKIKFDKNYPL
jgi:hypothetical protein